jgi:TRAP transporter TAXI family solute receptor
MRANAGRVLLLISAMYAITGLTQTSALADDLSLNKLKIAQSYSVPRAPTAAASDEGHARSKVNRWVVGLATGIPEGTYIRVGGEIARNLNSGTELRVIPMVTTGAVDNVRDLLYLKGVDIALTNADVLEHFKTVENVPNIERRIQYICELHITDIHLLVRPEIGSFKDLEGKKVSFNLAGTGAALSAPIIFQRLGVKVEPVYISSSIALEKMKAGEFAGLVNPGGKPQALFTRFKNNDGFKFLPIPFDKFTEYYVPRAFTDEDYPGYIKPGEKVETIGVPVVLAVYNWPKDTDRFRRVQRFIEYFFDRFEAFQRPPYHPDWKSINLTGKVPGWTRYWAVEEKLKRMAVAAAAKSQSRPQPVDAQLPR